VGTSSHRSAPKLQKRALAEATLMPVGDNWNQDAGIPAAPASAHRVGIEASASRESGMEASVGWTGREGARPGVKWLEALELKGLMGSASFGRLASLAASRLARA
jgi:hypothetical protein